MQTLKTIRNAAILTIAAMSVTAPIAQAASPDTVEVNVSFDARDFNTQTGVVAVYRKLKAKANRECVTNGQKALANRIAERRCSADLLNAFVIDANSVELMKLHKTVTG